MKMEEKTIDIGKALGVAVIIVLVTIGLFLMFTTVPAGHVGVKDKFGKVYEQEFKSGFHFKSPLISVNKMSVKTQEVKEKSQTPSEEGLIVTLETSTLYKLNPDKANEIYSKVGKNYEEVYIIPKFRSAIREATAKYNVKELYTEGRKKIEKDVYDNLKDDFAERGIILEDVLLRDLIIPDKVKSAIETKLEAEQESLKYEFILEREEKEAKRKIIEARGIEQSQKIINNTLTTEYLQYLWVNKLNENENVIYVPISEQGLPLYKSVK